MIRGALSLAASDGALPGEDAEKLQPTRTSAKKAARMAGSIQRSDARVVSDLTD